MKSNVVFCSPITIIIVITIIKIIFPPAVAASSTSLTVSPAILESIVKPGEDITHIVTVANMTDIPLPIKGTVRNFISTDTNDTTPSSAYDASSWFELDPADFILQPKSETAVTVHIKAPVSTEPGGHYATIYFEPLIPRSAVSPESSLSLARVGVLTFLIAPGNIREQIKLTGYDVSKFKLTGPIPIQFELENEGNIHVMPSGKLQVTDMFGRSVSSIPIPTATILPGSRKKYEVQWDKWLIAGKFTITGDIAYSSGGDKITIPKQDVWIAPIHILVLGIVLLTTTLYIVIVGRRRISLAFAILTGRKDIPH